MWFTWPNSKEEYLYASGDLVQLIFHELQTPGSRLDTCSAWEKIVQADSANQLTEPLEWEQYCTLLWDY